MFSEVLDQISWDDTTARIASKTDADVRRALSKDRCDVEDFMALISPAAEPYLEQMARLSKKYTEERFGRTISMFVPLYLTNSCTNSCVYCGFHISNPMKRTILTEEEIVNEYKAIKRLAPFENLLIVTGENPAKAGVPYIARALDLAKPYFSNLKIEVMPLKAEEYEELTHHGMNGVICFQETYNRAHYNIYHPRGMKSKFEWRLDGFDRMGHAGVHSIGMGVLIGLEREWRTDITMMAHHLRYLQKHRRIPTERGHDRPGAGAGHLCHAHLRPRRGHLLLYPRTSLHPRPHGHAGCHHDERREQDRTGRLLHLSAGIGTIPRQRRAYRTRGGRRPAPHGTRAGLEGLGCLV